MKVFAISDLHLDINNSKPMDVFGPVWENYLDEIIIKTIDQTKNLYWNNNKENITPSELRKVLEQWIATEFKGFCERKGIKFHNMILVFIKQCNARL